MARIRSVKPELWTDPEFTECSLSARLLFIASWNFVTNPDSDIAEQLSNLTAARKTAIKRQRRVRCGTEAGYQAHIARGEWACKLCTIAHETETA